jgi:hypothetical protein
MAILTTLAVIFLIGWLYQEKPAQSREDEKGKE